MATPPDLAGFHAELTRMATERRFSGAASAACDGEQIFGQAYGLASQTWQAPCTLNTRFDTASITKLFTTVAILQLVERGEFDLDTPAVEYLGLTGTAISPMVTPYHLLTHTSGIADDADEEAGERYEDLFVDEPNYAFTETADHLPHFVTKPPNFAPGEGCRYCNVGYLLLGLMIERATGGSYREQVSANVFGPAGMARTGFFRMDVVEHDVAEHVEPIFDGDQRIVGWRRNIYSYPPVGDPAGGAYTTVGDLLAFHRALTAGQLLGPELTAAMLAPHEVHTRKPGLTRMTGYGFEFTLDDDGSIRSYQKEGVNVGVSGMLRHYPGRDLTLAILGIGSKAVWQPVELFDAAVGPRAAS
jgi:CubicO group peptidase (beta-lactamase class C family)